MMRGGEGDWTLMGGGILMIFGTTSGWGTADPTTGVGRSVEVGWEGSGKNFWIL